MGINVNDAFPSNYLKASDLQGRNVTVTIDRVDMEMIGNGSNREQKMVMYFAGKDKGMVVNKTNANNIAAMYGPDTDGWLGQKVMLYEAMVPYQGRDVPALRVRGIPGGPSAAGRVQPAQRQAPSRHPNAPDQWREGDNGAVNDLNDEVPF